MSKWIRFTALAVFASFTICAAGMAAPAKSTKKAPAKKTTTTQHYVKGTTQLSGENAKFGTTYTLGKEDPMNITIKSAEYSVKPVLIGDELHTVTKDEKFLILHMTYHNPQKKEAFMRSDILEYTVVDAQDQNHDRLVDIGAVKDNSSVSMNMKPAQKMEVFGAIRVPAKGQMPKLIIKSNDNLVLRYDLRGNVKGMSEPYADPSDKTGATALPTIAAAMGKYYPVGPFEFKVNKLERSNAAIIGENELEEDEEFFILHINLKNVRPMDEFFRYDIFDTQITDVDDVEAGRVVDLCQNSKDRSFASNIKYGQELALRYILRVPTDTDLKKFSVSYQEGRIFEFDISESE